MDELRIEIDHPIEEHDALGLSRRIAAEVGEQLSLLQQRRVEAILAGRSQGGLVHIDTLGLVLRGREAERPNVRAIALSLADAVERKLG